MLKKIKSFFVFYQKYSAVNDKTKKDMTRFYLATVGGLTANTVAVAVFLPGFAIYIGANDTLASIISSMSVYSFLPMFLSPLIYEKLVRRRKAMCTMQFTAYLLICGSVIIPLFFLGKVAGLILLAVTAIGMILYGMVTAGTNVWVMEIVDVKYRADYFSRRELLDKLVICVVVFVLGYVLDYFEKGYIGFLIIFITAYFFAIMQFYHMSKITDIKYELSADKTTISDLIKIPFKNKEYRNLTIYIAVFFFFAWLCYSFRNIYMLKYLEVSFVVYSVLYSFRMIIQGMASPFWGKVGQKKGWFVVFVGCLVFFSLEYISWAFVTHNSVWMLILSHIFSGIANSGLVLATLNLRYDRMPKIQKSVYEGFYNLILGIGCILGPFVGNMIRVNMPVITGSFFPNSPIQFMFMISFTVNNLLIVYLIINKNKFNSEAKMGSNI